MSWITDIAFEHNKRVEVPKPDVDMFVAFIPHDRTACAYYRCINPAVELRNAKLARTVFGAELNDEEKLGAMVECDILVIEREDRPVWLELAKLLKSVGKGVVFETDDYVHLAGDTKVAKIAEYWSENTLAGLTAIMREADLVTVTTQKMAKKYQAMSGTRTVVLANQIDCNSPRWDFERPDKGEEICIAYQGGYTHPQDLELVRKPVEVIMKKFSYVTFLVNTPTMPAWPYKLRKEFPGRVTVDVTHRNLDEYPKELAKADIGIIPLQDHGFNRTGKSSLKFLEYTMAGLCSVVSPVGVYKREIRNGDIGFTARTEEEWITRLTALVTSKSLIKDTHRKALLYVAKSRTYPKHIVEWYRAYRSVYNIRRPSIEMTKQELADSIQRIIAEHQATDDQSNSLAT